MAAFDGEQIYQAAQFEPDVREKTFTLCRADNTAQFNYSMKRFETLSSRYDGWEPVVPARFEKLVRERAFARN